MFKIGDRIVHPMYGAGIITEKQVKEVLGTTQEYFIIELATKNDVIMLPVVNFDTSGVRDIVSSEIATEVIGFLKTATDKGNENWNKRYRDNFEKIKTGDIFEVANVVSELTNRDLDKGLSAREKKMLSNAKNILFSELSYVTGEMTSFFEDIVKGRC